MRKLGMPDCYPHAIGQDGPRNHEQLLICSWTYVARAAGLVLPVVELHDDLDVGDLNLFPQAICQNGPINRTCNDHRVACERALRFCLIVSR